MRATKFAERTAAAIGACALAGCNAGQLDTKRAVVDFTACANEVKETPEWKAVSARIWQFDTSDTADKLTDSKPLSESERNDLVQVHAKMQPCRQIIISLL
jgi:hypothetical protein